VLGTGGTIAGMGGADYQAGQLPIERLMANALGGDEERAEDGVQDAVQDAVKNRAAKVVCEQITQIDSKDMNFSVWQQLYSRLTEAMANTSVQAVLVTHGTDTLEETAYFLHRVLICTKPVILTGAMRPADSEETDGPQNLTDSIRLSTTLEAGVWTVMAGQALAAVGLQKNHPHHLDTFSQRMLHLPPDFQHQPYRLARQIARPAVQWPRVEIVMNYAANDGQTVEALLAPTDVSHKLSGLVVAGTGNGTISKGLEAALNKAVQAGVAVRVSTRCLQGSVIQNSHHPFVVSPLSPVQARVELMLGLMQSS
jgi:L-asparaginase